MKKLFALLCVIALLGVFCIPAMAAPARVAVAAQVPEDWTTPYLYAWGNAEETPWPGVPMTLIDDWYVAYMNDDNANIIINNGSDAAKTGDLTVTPGLPVCVIAIDPSNVAVDVELPIEVPDESEMPKPAADTVYALVPEAWTSAYVYAWGDSGAMTWPGNAMTKGDDGLWVGELTPGYSNVIIAEKDGGAQTVDLPYAGGECWVLLTAEPTDGAKFKANVCYEKPATIVHPTDAEIVAPVVPDAPVYTDWYVAGTMNEWNCADPAYKMVDDGDGTYSLTFTVTAGNHALKVTNGTWDVSYGGNGADGNYEFGMEADGEVTVNFDGKGLVEVIGGVEPVAGEKTWYVAGTMNEWNCADPAYQMTKAEDGSYVYSFKATPGDYALKVTNGTWDESYGGDGADGNYEFNVTDECYVNVKFADNTVSHDFSSEPAPTPDPEPTPAPTPANTSLIISIVATVVILIGGGVAVFFVLKKKK